MGELFEFILTGILTFLVMKILYELCKHDESPFFLDL